MRRRGRASPFFIVAHEVARLIVADAVPACGSSRRRSSIENASGSDFISQYFTRRILSELHEFQAVFLRDQ